ncbi:hypothetical protein LINGRAHAP2_LOCUS14441 [Linum grandiflorum]
MLDTYNVLTQSLRCVRDSFQEPGKENLRLHICGPRVEHGRMYELPTGTELAGLIPEDFAFDQDDCDIIVNNKATGLKRITSLNPLFDSLHFPMLFPHGNDRFHNRIRYNPTNRDPTKKRKYSHINVKICHKGQLIKYLFKYITKGPDRSEIAQYLDYRSISLYEAVWGLFKFHIHEQSNPVSRLSVHLPGELPITYEERQSIASIITRPYIEKTMLTEWFQLNRSYPSARKYPYSDIPQAFVWDKQCTQWTPRKKGFSI